MATVLNDFIQGIVMLVGIVAVIAVVLAGQGGFSEAIISLSQIPAEGTDMQGAFVSMFGPDLFNLVGVIVLTSLGTWGLPQMVSKFYAIKTGPAIKQGAIISTVFAFVVAAAVTSWADSAACSVIRSPSPPAAFPFTTPSSQPCSPGCPISCSASLWCSFCRLPCLRFLRWCSPLLPR